MARATTVSLRRKTTLRALMAGVFRRVIRRSFFRLVLLAVLLVTAVVLLVNFLATRNAANGLIDRAVAGVLNPEHAEATWDRERTEITGPGVLGSGEIHVFNLRVARKGGVTAHPGRAPLKYDFLSIPEVKLSYDLKRLPRLPITSVEFGQGLTLHFNMHRGAWLDEDLFKPGEEGGGATSLPEIVVKGEAVVNVRADGILVPPESLAAGDEKPEWYRFALTELGLLPSTSKADEYSLNGTASAERLGTFKLGGKVKRDGTLTDIRFQNEKEIEVNQRFVSILAPEIRATVDQFQVTAKANMAGGIRIKPMEAVQFSADIEAKEGSMCFVGFPAAVTEASANIQLVNNSLKVQARGRRDGAFVDVDVRVEDIGGAAEQLRVDVSIRDLLVDEKFRRTLLPARLQPENAKPDTGLPWPKEEFDERDPNKARVKGYPDWPGKPRWDGGLIEPAVDDVLPFICRGFTPMGLCNFELRFRSDAKGRTREGVRTLETELRWKVFIRDATGCYTGLPESVGDGFPVPMHRCYGVVEGSVSTGQAGRYTVRGYTADELAALGEEAGHDLVAWDKKGLTGVLDAAAERVWIFAAYTELAPATQRPYLRLDLESEGLNFSENFATRLPPYVRDAIQQFGPPKGAVDIVKASVEIWPDKRGDLTFWFDLKSKGVTARYLLEGAKEPLAFSEVRGNLEIRNGGKLVSLKSVEGKLMGSPLTMDLVYDNGGVPSLSIKSDGPDGFMLDSRLDNMLPSGIGGVLRDFDVSGRVNILITGRRMVSGKPDFTEAKVVFLAPVAGQGAEMRFVDIFPYQLTGVTGTVYVSVTPTAVDVYVDDLGQGRAGDSTDGRPMIRISGHVMVPVDQPGQPEQKAVYDLRVMAERVPADKTLIDGLTPLLRRGSSGEALPDSAAKPAVVQFIEDLRATGTIGVTGRITAGPDGKPDWRVEMKLEGTGVNFTNFPYPLDGLYGTVVIDGADVALREVTGRAEKGSFTLHNAGYTEAEGWTVLLSARQVSFHETPTLRNALKPVSKPSSALQKLFDRMDPHGKFDIDMEISGKDDFMRFQVSLDVYETDLDLGLHFDDMTARFDYEGVREGGSMRGSGRVNIKEVFFKKARFADVTSSLQYFGDRLEFPNLRGHFYDGWLEGRFGMVGENDYSGELVVRRADLKQLGSTAFGTEDISGAMDAEIKFHSHVDNEGQIGHGRIDVGAINRNSEDPDPKIQEKEKDCKLAAVPLFNEVLRLAGGEQNFDEAHVYFWLGPESINIRELDVVSDAARVETFGGIESNYIRYDTNEMRMKLFFTALPRLAIQIPVFQQILDELKKILLPLYVTGTLTAPKVEKFSLSTQEAESPRDQFPRRPRGP